MWPELISREAEKCSLISGTVTSEKSQVLLLKNNSKMDFEGKPADSATTSSKTHGISATCFFREIHEPYFTVWSLNSPETLNWAQITSFGADDAWVRDYFFLMCELPRHKIWIKQGLRQESECLNAKY